MPFLSPLRANAWFSFQHHWEAPARQRSSACLDSLVRAHSVELCAEANLSLVRRASRAEQTGYSRGHDGLVAPDEISSVGCEATVTQSVNLKLPEGVQQVPGHSDAYPDLVEFHDGGLEGEGIEANLERHLPSSSQAGQ